MPLLSPARWETLRYLGEPGRLAARPAPDQRLRDRWGFGQLAALQLFEGQPRGLDVGDGVAVAVAAVGEELPGRLEAVLPARGAGLLGADVLEEEQLAAGLEDAGGLGQRGAWVWHGAQHQREDRRVEAVVLEGQLFGARFDQLDLGPALGQLLPQPLGHVRVGLGHDHVGPGWEEPQVGAGPGADVDRAASRR